MNRSKLIMSIVKTLEDYLDDRERILREKFRYPVTITKEWNGYLIKLQGYAIKAAYDGSTHRWRFVTLEETPGGYYIDNTEFFNISEKKGEAIIEFLHALAAVTKKSSSEGPFRDEETVGTAGAKGFSEDLSVLGEEIFDGAPSDFIRDIKSIIQAVVEDRELLRQLAGGMHDILYTES